MWQSPYVMKTIALVEMADDTENFYIENPPKGEISNWIKNHVNDVREVEYVTILEVKETLKVWANPNCMPEE